MDFIFLLQHPHMQNVFCFFLESINSYICGKALSLNSNELYFSFMNSKPCAISSSLKSDTIVFNVGTCLHFNNIKMEIKLQHNGVCPGISTSDSPVVRKFRIAISHSCISFDWNQKIRYQKQRTDDKKTPYAKCKECSEVGSVNMEIDINFNLCDNRQR